MKILCLSDLHLWFYNDSSVYADDLLYTYKLYLQKILKYNKYDCIVITGDIFESSFKGNPYKELRNLFGVSDDIPIICCLGNHEFAYSTIDKVHRFYNSFDKRYNIHYLDIEGKFEFNGYNFIGNVLWYDNSLICNVNSYPDIIVKNWLDYTIKNFVPSVECQKCKEQIINNCSNILPNILLTHCVPNIELNRFSELTPTGIYNQYSGCKHFLDELSDKNIIFSVCGHTHKSIDIVYNNIHCINVGNDYFDNTKEIKFFVKELS